MNEKQLQQIKEALEQHSLSIEVKLMVSLLLDIADKQAKEILLLKKEIELLKNNSKKSSFSSKHSLKKR